MVTVDFRGHGRSDKPASQYSISRFAADTIGLIEDLRLAPVTVVGLSLGGIVALQVAADRPVLVERLVVVNAVPEIRLEGIGPVLRKALVSVLGMKRWGKVLAGRIFPGPDMAEQRAAMVSRFAENDKRAYQRSFQAILDWDGVVDAMNRFERPTLFIASDQDYGPPEAKRRSPMPCRRRRWWSSRTPTTRYQSSAPEPFNQALELFLART